jgi:hypothetical protein
MVDGSSILFSNGMQTWQEAVDQFDDQIVWNFFPGFQCGI